MMYHFRFLFLTFLLPTLAWCEGAPLGVCAVVNAVEDLDGRSVTLRATVYRMDEFAMFVEKGCEQHILFTFPHSDGKASDLTLLKDEMFKVYSLASNLMTFGDKPERDLNVIVVGRFESAVVSKSGRPTPKGFGMWEAFRHRLIVTRVLKVEFTHSAALASMK